MITVKEVEKLANLARIKIDESEKEKITKEISSILAYIDEIIKATVNVDYTPTPNIVHNVFREDKVFGSDNITRENILNEAPSREKDFIAVKKIIEQDIKI